MNVVTAAITRQVQLREYSSFSFVQEALSVRRGSPLPATAECIHAAGPTDWGQPVQELDHWSVAG